MKISIIIVNWNSCSQLLDAVTSISKYHHGLVKEVIIVDNSSTDDSLAQVEELENLPFHLEIIRNDVNRGFGFACNQGATASASEYLLFLNPDTRLFDTSLPVSISYIQDPNNKNVGLVGIQLLDENMNVGRSCARFPTLGTFVYQAFGINRLPGLRQLNMHMLDWEHDETRVVDHVIGAYYLMRRSLFILLGGFDERFFLYLEDLDFSLRVKQVGYHSVYLATAKAFHAGGGTSRQVKALRLFYSLRSRLMYGFKHYSPWQAWILVLITLGIESVTRSIFSFMDSGFIGMRSTWQGYYLLWSDMKFIVGRRHS